MIISSDIFVKIFLQKAKPEFELKGSSDGSKLLDLNDRLTGTGGIWEYWYVDDGQFNSQSAISPDCSGMISEELIRIHDGAIFIEHESGLTLKEKDGNCYQISIDESGNLVHQQVECPKKNSNFLIDVLRYIF